ncbi:MAG: bacillithiol system redox-active protein YtxJ [Haliscomenobacter sp.]|nr:bacillithiol system redox-active protein YtxJ [Haliscomenobacter sp.]
MNKIWSNLTEESQIAEIIALSNSIPIYIFKHSTTCGISAQAKENLEISFKNTDKPFLLYYLDLLKYRSISNEVASKLNVHHQSPQLILVHNGEVAFTTSHHKIKTNILEDSLSLLK